MQMQMFTKGKFYHFLNAIETSIMFSFSCDFCGKHAPGDFTESVICKVDEKFRQGIFSPYNRSAEGLYFSMVTLLDGTVAILNPEFEKTKGMSMSHLPNNFALATEIYCNGVVETCEDETDIRNHRYCRPTQFGE